MERDVKVFISYSHADRALAGDICKVLESLQIEYFLDIKDIPWGGEIGGRVEGGMANCSHLIVIISENSRKSSWVPYEVGLAKGQGLTVLPYLANLDEKPFPFISGLLYKARRRDIRTYFSALVQNRTQLRYPNTKPFRVGDFVLNSVYLMYGNYTAPIEIKTRYRKDTITLPQSLSEVYPYLAEHAKTRASESGYQYFNGPNTRLIRFTEENTRQTATGHEQKGATLELGPVSWEEYTVLNTFLDYKLRNGHSIREVFADYGMLYINDRDLRWCPLSNIMCVAMLPITSDGYGLVQRRNPKGVSSEGGQLTSGVAENIHRYLDEAPEDQPGKRLHELALPVDLQQTGEIDVNYDPNGVPSPLLTAQRGIWEEISEELYRRTPLTAYKFLNIAFELTKFHPALIGVVELELSRIEVEHIIGNSPGRDHSEFLDIEYLPLNILEPVTSSALASPGKWVDAGLAAFISAVHYWNTRRYFR